MGEDTLYSGTVAAATEGYLFGIPAIAFSLTEKGWEHIDGAARIARTIVEQQTQNPLGSPVLLNVNIPAVPFETIQELRVTRLGKRHRSEEHTSELQSLMRTSYAVFCLQKKNN